MTKKLNSKFVTFEHARRVMREENLDDVKSFKYWHKHNCPARIPSRPETIYRKEWQGWNDFLGTKNVFPLIKKKYKSFTDAKRFARALHLTSSTDWYDYCKRGKRPLDIPSRPAYYYRNEWVSWKDWLGSDTSLKNIFKEVENVKILLFIIRMPNKPMNVFKINTTYGGQPAIMELVNDGGKILSIFEYDDRIDLDKLLTKFGSGYWKGDSDEYMFSNIHEFISNLSSNLSLYKWKY